MHRWSSVLVMQGCCISQSLAKKRQTTDRVSAKRRSLARLTAEQHECSPSLTYLLTILHKR